MDNNTKLTQAETAIELIDQVYRNGAYLTDADMENAREQVQATLTDLASAQPNGELKSELVDRYTEIDVHFGSGVAPHGVLVAVIIAAAGPIRRALAA